MSETINFRNLRSNIALYSAILFLLIIHLSAFFFFSHVPTTALLVSVNIWSFALLFLAQQLRIHFKKSHLIWVLPLLGVLVALYVISPTTTHSGWPGNHEYTFWKDRMMNYYHHFMAGDFFPIWSQADALGFGTPLPLYYHKLFYYVFTSAYILVGQVKASLILALALFMLTGVIGISICLRQLKVADHVILPVSLAILLMNYTSTDWLVRGNMAEFSAMCILPWLINWCLILINTSRFSWSIVPIFFFLFHAHNIVAFYGVFMILLTILIEIFRKRNTQTLIQFVWKGVILAGAFLLLNAPYFLAMHRLSTYYDVGRIRNKMEVSRLYEPFTAYFFDRQYIWGEHVNHISVEINLLFTLVISFILGDLLLRIYREAGSTKKTIYLLVNKWKLGPLPFITLSLAFLFYLQHPWSLWFYNVIPGADFIQFPWRLLSYISVLLLLLLGYLLHYGRLRYFHKTAMAYLFFLGLLIQYPFMKYSDSDDWKWLPSELIEASHNGGVWGTAGEYNPLVDEKHIDSPAYYEMLKSYGIESNHSININYIDSASNILIKIYHAAVEEENTLVVFPFNYSGAEELILQTGEERKTIPIFRTENDPRIRVFMPSGEYEIRLTHPTLFLALKMY